MKIVSLDDLEEVYEKWEVGEPGSRNKVAFRGPCCDLGQAGTPEYFHFKLDNSSSQVPG